MLFDVLKYLFIMAGALILGLILRFRIRRQLERRAWGTGRATLSRADRHEIRSAVREGRQVRDPRLATPAVLFGERVGASSTWMNYGLGTPPPHWLFVCGRIFFPAVGAYAAVSGIFDHDRVTLLSGIVLFVFTALYLPSSERRMAARRAQRDQQRRIAIDANRLLSPEP